MKGAYYCMALFILLHSVRISYILTEAAFVCVMIQIPTQLI